jgi:hypothetical protein
MHTYVVFGVDITFPTALWSLLLFVLCARDILFCYSFPSLKRLKKNKSVCARDVFCCIGIEHCTEHLCIQYIGRLVMMG